MPELDGRVAVVTGAGNGLGRTFAIELARRGARVLVNNRRRVVDDAGRHRADLVVEQIRAAGGEAAANFEDAADPGSGARIVEQALETWGRLDICVLNASIIDIGDGFEQQSADSARNVVAVNLQGALSLAHAAYSEMLEAGYGRIVMISATGGLNGYPTAAAYSASKGGTIALAKTLAAEGADRGVRANVVLPFAFGTGMTVDRLDAETAELLPLDSVAPVVAALADERCDLNGEVMIVGADRIRKISTVEWTPVEFDRAGLTPSGLADLVVESGSGTPSTYSNARLAFTSFLGLDRG